MTTTHDTATHEGGHHDTPEQRDKKELSALILLIAGDGLFLVLEILTWFYLRALNPHHGWRFSTASPTSPATSGSNNPHDITAEVAKAPVSWSLLVILATLAVGGLVWFGEMRSRKGESPVPALGLALLMGLVAIGLQVYQFQTLPFQTTDGTYASCFEFFMASNLAHQFLALIVVLGVWNRGRKNLYARNWYQLRLARIWTMWVGISALLLGAVSILFV